MHGNQSLLRASTTIDFHTLDPEYLQLFMELRRRVCYNFDVGDENFD